MSPNPSRSFTFNASEGIVNNRDLIFKFQYPDNPTVGALKEGSNIKIDHEGNWSLREGTLKVYSGTPHSLDPLGSGLFVESSILKLLKPDYSTTTMATMSNNNPMVYENLLDRGIVCSNGVDIGIVKGNVYTPFPDPTQRYKRKISGGQLLTLFKGNLYVARGSDIFVSDPQAYGIMDTRNKKKRFKGYITLMVGVDDGMYISDSHDTFFYSGVDPHVMKAVEVADYPAIYGMYKKVEETLIGEGNSGITYYWLSTQGVCVGTNGGNMKNHTIKKYTLSDIPSKGTAFFRYDNGIPQFIAPGQII